eukprot:5623650-Prymnesium_polylepis.5
MSSLRSTAPTATVDADRIESGAPPRADRPVGSSTRSTSGLNIAVCLLGLERATDLIADNMAIVLSHLNRRGTLHAFGVQPVSETWSNVYRVLSRARLLDNTTVEPQVWHTNMTAPSWFSPRKSGRGFIIELWDNNHCHDMISAAEHRLGWQYHAIVRMRLDTYWEFVPAVPPTFEPNTVHVPYMSRCNGINDKFAMGDRAGMRTYLTRAQRLWTIVPNRAFSSEQYLQNQLRTYKTTVSSAAWTAPRDGTTRRPRPGRSAPIASGSGWAASGSTAPGAARAAAASTRPATESAAGLLDDEVPAAAAHARSDSPCKENSEQHERLTRHEPPAAVGRSELHAAGRDVERRRKPHLRPHTHTCAA